ncbi:MAG: glycoside hydrolase family 127 protein [Proteobacteria bacterium]|uniref:beta-L-arabinofuranosidase domain-containing protein n=1 Tax=Rudaea sp. TaxID=2136325 RepID=UPI00322057C6|nr:glycoside hydrolase family 127 protein [Pseudomonadota bacterium]
MSDLRVTRRKLLAGSAWAAGGLALSRTVRGVSDTANFAAPLAELDYGQVQLGEGPLEKQARENHRVLLDFDEDALLYPFRKRAGQPAPGRDLGGWYGSDDFCPGAHFGQWLGGLARYYAITGDEPTRAKVGRLVRGFAATIEPEGRFYRHYRFPAYTYDKLTQGLVEARRWANDGDALATLRRATRVALPYLPPRALPRNEHARDGEDFSEHAWDESYTLPENQFLAWRASGDAQHRELARRFLYDEFFFALARGENALPGKHAYSHVNALSSAARAYLALGDRRYFEAARQGLEMVHAQSFATGGWGPDEHFVEPGSGKLGASLAAEHKSFETPCGAYAHFKLTRYLLRITRDARYGDSMERVLYNTVLGARLIQGDGRAFYYSDYTRRARKEFFASHWPCCSGTLPLAAADYRICTGFADAQGIYVNLYVPARIRWRQNGTACALAIATGYPHAGDIALTLNLTSAQIFAVNLRIPAWAEGAHVAVNGRRVDYAIEPGTFAALRRTWRDGDRIELALPLRLRLQPVDVEHPNLVALSSGPLVLMRVGDDGAAPALPRGALLSAQRHGDSARDWRVTDGARAVTLRAFADIADETYSAYQDVTPT